MQASEILKIRRSDKNKIGIFYYTIPRHQSSDEVGYPKTWNPGGNNPNPNNETRPEPEKRKPLLE